MTVDNIKRWTGIIVSIAAPMAIALAAILPDLYGGDTDQYQHIEHTIDGILAIVGAIGSSIVTITHSIQAGLPKESN